MIAKLHGFRRAVPKDNFKPPRSFTVNSTKINEYVALEVNNSSDSNAGWFISTSNFSDLSYETKSKKLLMVSIQML